MKFSRKTWYIALVLSAAVSLSVHLGAMVGLEVGTLNVAAFGAMGLATLFLAAERDNEKSIRMNYFQSFLLGMVGYAFGGVAGLVGGAAAWPMLLYTEWKREMPVAQGLRLVALAEMMYVTFAALVLFAGLTSVVFFVNLFGALAAVACGWAALGLVRHPEQTGGSDA